ncbi:dipeptidyl aminopeptidase-like protein 6 isoform X3 [Symsagittifera roscoffensis]|uniref:dipeptidyl aminopeptidase-like protein 6 isoform X3 n=1 Tax=Symsagittifera roscoffensis TaxID=84072 RepID=UPI00307C970F
MVTVHISTSNLEHNNKREIDADDLVGAEPEKRNWKGIALALLTICFVFLLVFIAVQVLTPDPIKTGSVDITLRHVADTSLTSPRTATVQWLSGSSLAVLDSNGDIAVYQGLDEMTDDGNYTKQTLVTRDDLAQFAHNKDSLEWSFSPDSQQQYILLASEFKSTTDNSEEPRKKCSIIDKDALTVKKNLPDKYKACKWFKTSDGKPAIVVIDENSNVRLIHFETSDSKMSPLHEAADKENVYGSPDLLYQALIWRSSEPALWISENQQRMVFAGFHDSKVAKSEVLDYYDGQTKLKQINFPKRGGDVPRVSLHYVSSTNGNGIEIIDENQFADKYLMDVGWISDSKIQTDWLDRAQNTLSSFVLDLESVGSRGVAFGKAIVKSLDQRDLKDDPKATNPRFVHCPVIRFIEGKQFVFDIQPRQSSTGSFLHLNKRDSESAGLGYFLTSGSFDVLKIIAVTSTHVYILAPIEGHPATRHVFSVDHDSKQMECLTCSLLPNECSFYDASLSPDQTWIELKCLGPDVPKTILTVLNFDQSSGERRPMIKIPADEELLKQINKLKVAHKEFMKVDDISLMLIKPPIVDINYKYPIVVYLSPFPEQQKVTSKWDFSYLDYMASTQKVFVAVIDTIGSQGYGVEFASTDKGKGGSRPGEAESEGIQKVLERLVEDEVIDASRIAILALEYGAYIAGELISNNEETVKCIAMVRAISNISSCQAYFAESKLPLARVKQVESPFADKVENFRDLNPLLIAGLTDEKILFEQTAQIINQLTQANIPFHSQIYTQLESNSEDVLKNSHVIHQLTAYLTRCLDVHVQ